MAGLRKSFVLLAVSAATSLSSLALSVSVDPPVVSAYPDTEATTNVVVAAWDGSMRYLDFTLEFNASLSNSFIVAFGQDSDRDGELSAGETDISIGWDCGNWVIENAKTGDTFIEASSVTSGVRCLEFKVRVDNFASVRELEVKDGANPIFAMLSESAPAWVFDRSWDVIRLTARGFDRCNEHFSINQASNGFHVRLK